MSTTTATPAPAPRTTTPCPACQGWGRYHMTRCARRDTPGAGVTR